MNERAELIAKARAWAANFQNSKGAERLNSAYYIKALADELEAVAGRAEGVGELPAPTPPVPLQ